MGLAKIPLGAFNGAPLSRALKYECISPLSGPAPKGGQMQVWFAE